MSNMELHSIPVADVSLTVVDVSYTVAVKTAALSCTALAAAGLLDLPSAGKADDWQHVTG